MKKFFVIAAIAALSLGTVAYADTLLQDFEAGTDGVAVAGAWRAGFSGTSNAHVLAASDAAIASSEQAAGGTLSCKLTWTWAHAAPGQVRIQPAEAGFLAGSDPVADRTAEPFIGLAVYGANQGDNIAIYMGEGANGASPYERFTPVLVDWTGWHYVQNNVVTDAVTGYLTGDGTLPVSCSFSGLTFDQVGQAAVAQTYYVDDLAFTVAARADDFPPAAVEDWSVF